MGSEVMIPSLSQAESQALSIYTFLICSADKIRERKHTDPDPRERKAAYDLADMLDAHAATVLDDSAFRGVLFDIISSGVVRDDMEDYVDLRVARVDFVKAMKLVGLADRLLPKEEEQENG